MKLSLEPFAFALISDDFLQRIHQEEPSVLVSEPADLREVLAF